MNQEEQALLSESEGVRRALMSVAYYLGQNSLIGLVSNEEKYAKFLESLHALKVSVNVARKDGRRTQKVFDPEGDAF